MRSFARVLAAFVLLVLAGCSSSGPGTADPTSPAAPSPAPPSPAAPSPASTFPAPREPSTRSEPPAYASSSEPISPELRHRLTSGSPSDCPVAVADLRHLRMSYLGFDGRAHEGEMVVATKHAADVVAVFARLYRAEFPIERMVLVDEYDGDDGRSMQANNTSSYNCRRVAGTDRWSEHAFGTAVDINPVQNPYVQGSSYVPRNGRRYADVARGPDASAAPGIITAGDVVVDAFARIGWVWGGTWTSSKDYQHFSFSEG